MILVDSSVWVDHLRAGNADLALLLQNGEVLTHAFVIGEIALGSLRQRDVVLSAMRGLPAAVRSSDDEVLAFIEGQALFGRGIGYIDAHLLASVRLTAGARLWTRDKRLLQVASALGVAAE